jgi:hypothetical protein
MKKLIIIFIVLLGPFYAMAQQPKMHLKLFGGWNVNAFAYRAEGLSSDYLHGWQAGVGFRVLHRKAFLEADITFLKYGLSYDLGEDENSTVDESLDIKIRSLEIPLNIGYVPVNKPLFKWFLYGGLVNKFNLQGQYTFEGETEKFKASELKLHLYNLGARFGTQVDFGMINVDLSYTIGIRNSFQSRMRTNNHGVLLSLGLAL